MITLELGDKKQLTIDSGKLTVTSDDGDKKRTLVTYLCRSECLALAVALKEEAPTR